MMDQSPRYLYWCIPLKCILTTGNKKLRFISSFGITTNVLVKASTTNISTFIDGKKTKTTQQSNETYNSINLSPTFSLGAEMRIKNRSFIRIEPTFRYGILNIIDAPITAKIWNAGLNINYYFGLK